MKIYNVFKVSDLVFPRVYVLSWSFSHATLLLKSLSNQ